MADLYYPLKLAHMSLAFTSISLFTLRALWAIAGSPRLERRWVKIGPHVVDTFLLLSAITLAVLSYQYPFHQPWLTAKVIALVLYIIFGSLAIRLVRGAPRKAFFALLALLTFTYILAVAFTKNPWPQPW